MSQNAGKMTMTLLQRTSSINNFVFSISDEQRGIVIAANYQKSQAAEKTQLPTGPKYLRTLKRRLLPHKNSLIFYLLAAMSRLIQEHDSSSPRKSANERKS